MSSFAAVTGNSASFDGNIRCKAPPDWRNSTFCTQRQIDGPETILYMDMDKIRRLLVKSANGDQQAFHTLYKITSPHLMSLAFRIVNRRRDVAEDVLQDAFVQIWHRATDYHSQKGSALAWMAGIVRFRALDARRREQSQQDRAESLASEQSERPEPPFLHPEQLAQTSVEVKRVMTCMKDIDSSHRESIIMAYCYGYSHKELADKLNKPIGTVKTLIRRGMILIRECLKR